MWRFGFAASAATRARELIDEKWPNHRQVITGVRHAVQRGGPVPSNYTEPAAGRRGALCARRLIFIGCAATAYYWPRRDVAKSMESAKLEGGERGGGVFRLL